MAAPRIVTREAVGRSGVLGTVSTLDDGITIPPRPRIIPWVQAPATRRERLAAARAGFVMTEATLMELPLNRPLGAKDRDVLLRVVQQTRRHFQALHPVGGLRGWWQAQDAGPFLHFLAACAWPAATLWIAIAILKAWSGGL